MKVIELVLLLVLIVCAIATSLNKNLLASVIIFMAYSVVMSIMWALLEAPDLAVTEAAVGAGISSVLFFITLRKIHLIKQDKDNEQNNIEN